MKILTILNAIAKTINFILIVTLIKDPDDFIFANIFFAAGGIICGIIAFIYIIKKHQLKFYIPGRLRLIYYLKDGWATFASNFSINIHFNASVIILGLFASPLIVGLYTLSERITFVIRTYLSVFFQAIFPRISHLSRISHDSVKTQFRSIYFYFLISVTGICLLTFTFSQEILFFLGETNSESANNYLKILVWGPLITSLNIPFFQVMLVYNLKNDYLKVYALGAILNIILNFVLVNLFSAYGSCAAIVVTDLFITAGLIYSLEYKNKNYSLMSIYKVKPF